ncbi:hypothetical protein ACS3SW_00765 [Roseobacteraceae bacterium S113]
MTPAHPWRYEASARGPRVLAILGLWWGLVLLGLFAINLSPWIAGVLLLVSLPAVIEMARGATAWLEVSETSIAWGSGRRSGDVARNEIEKVRFDTRLDLSVRVSLVLVSGRRVRLPYECIPRAARLKEALEAAGYVHEHHHFALMS